MMHLTSFINDEARLLVDQYQYRIFKVKVELTLSSTICDQKRLGFNRALHHVYWLSNKKIK